MNKDFDFNGLFVLDMANNHQGQVEHAERIVEEIGRVVRDESVRAALKFQFRDLDTFIHPDHRSGSAHKRVQRFQSTRLSKDEFEHLTNEVRNQGMITMSTPFDESSVDWIEEFGMDVLKVASCSANDWPLLERIAESNKPVIASTGGLSMKEIDDLVSFLDHKRVHFGIMHCVAIYPTPDEHLQLNQIAALRQRYRDKVIGFSTHEDPSDTVPVGLAIALGAEMLERHVGVPTDEISLNAYSSTPQQLRAWLQAAKRARTLCGADERPESPEEEQNALRSLRRGVYAKKRIKNGSKIKRSEVYFAIPYHEKQLSSGHFKEGLKARDVIEIDEPVLLPSIDVPKDSDRQILFTAIHTMKAMLNEAKVALNTDFEAEFSHHYGLDRFKEVGATIITCVNRSYCKKLVVQIPGQRHPSHYHKRKEETFQVLHGVLEVEIEGRRRTLYPGDTLLVQQGVWHEFWSDTGVIFEEVSTQHHNNDSFYEDKRINEIGRDERKTTVNNWGRYQI